MENQLLIGDKMPEMQVKTTHGEMNIPKDFEGKWFVLFSHPADFTPVCTTEFVAFQKRYEEFEKLNTELIGLSIDQVFSHIKWVEWINDEIGEEIKFPVIADDRGKVADKLGLVAPNKGTNTVRGVYIVDPKGVIRAILLYPQELGRNMDEIVRMIKGFQVNEKEGVAIPANWPNNELLKDRVIIEPASDEKTAKERLKEYDCYDWWFCHKELDQ
ncbi:peroxiredoxin [Halanaerobiaceae bacterium Z-7014]|uniref:Peroxiredoxin n=1 Tax=Halonatronomonas betaini TaxID=2778430 RepID=A0A931F7L5_9FIRM|nr:peroxiredoxin [Halonatronomonas betaini]MBF8435613.1 peroxiredoxin [Halonatronomonas betaini]